MSISMRVRLFGALEHERVDVEPPDDHAQRGGHESRRDVAPAERAARGLVRRLGWFLQGPHEIQLPRGFVGDGLLGRDGQDWLEMDLDLAEEPVIDRAHVDVAIA